MATEIQGLSNDDQTSEMQFESDPNSYWGKRIRKFVAGNPEEGLQQFKGTFHIYIMH